VSSATFPYPVLHQTWVIEMWAVIRSERQISDAKPRLAFWSIVLVNEWVLLRNPLARVLEVMISPVM
jgi:hypothetical protein